MKPTRYGIPLAYTPEHPIWEEDIRRLTWRDLVNLVCATVVVAGAILGLVLLLSLGGPA